DRGSAQSDQQRGTPSDAIRKAAPHRRAQQLGHRERSDDEARDKTDAEMKAENVESGTTEVLHIKRQEREDHQYAQHVNERGGHEGEEFRRNSPHFAPEDVEQSDSNRN